MTTLRWGRIDAGLNRGQRIGVLVIVLLSTVVLCSSAQAGFLPGRIAYVDDHVHALYTVVPGNPHSTQLIDSAGFAHSPRWSPNGQTLAFFAQDGVAGSPWQKSVLANRAGRVPGDLRQGTPSEISGLDFSPDGNRIAYTCGNDKTPAD